MTEWIREIYAGDWEKEVLSAPRAIVDFYSTDCPPCEALAGKYEPLSELYGREIPFFKVFRQKNRDLAGSLGVTSSPTVLFYKNGEPGARFSGAIKRKDLVSQLDALLPTDTAAAIHARVRPSVTETDVLILGAGPAGLTAAIYAAQAKARTLVVDLAMPGGQVASTHQVSNYPGFIEPVPGYLLAHTMREQAVKAGALFRSAVDLTEVDLINKQIVIDGVETLRAKRIILSTGASPRPLGIPGESEYRGKGISYCATCDAKYFQGKEVVVIGGGDSALEESLFIARFASRVTVAFRADHPRAKASILESVRATANIHLLPRHKPLAFHRNEDLTMGVDLEESPSGERKRLATDGIFVFIGMRPNVVGFPDGLALDPEGYVKVDGNMRTSIPGVYAAGDIVQKRIRQITIAVSEGTIAGIESSKDL